ncbi:hypothetical protein CFC21_079194 [Triticum aestivum]|uniref:NB-ARC domain-containing protein n=2 Tax=Triticum aestivum TaxID=4565 RepID=A0A9R1KJC0_WHEAT|nr:hypothetical protein CFC21_063641 [Triticum aestivum]KAF7074296.1 hypothetical protein CFC21_079194 [Triticum aestivum]
MADFALGLTKTAVEGTLSRVKSAIEEEAKLKEKVHQDLVFIIGEFQMMQSFLETAKWERAKNKVANTWVRQLRELAFDVEDCVEFVVHLDKDSAWWWRVVPSCMAPPRHLDEAAAEIKQLKARVEDVSHRNMRNNLISDSGSHSKIVMPMAPAATTSSPLAFDNLRQVWEAAGKIRDTGDLQDLIRHEDSDLRVISVWGSTGDDLGMTSIFSKAYCGKKISQEFKSRAWVKLIHPFNPEEFLKNLLTQFYESSHQANVDVGHLNKAQLMQQVMEHKYLIIVEGVSTVVEWNAIKMYLPNNKKGSRILVSTQDLGIALQSPGEPYLVSELGRFSDGKSLCAFFKRTPRRHSDMGELKWQIKCRGVISVHGSAPSKSIIARRLYRGIMYNREEFDGVEFQTHRWVHVVHPFDLMDFSRRLFLDLSSYGFNDDELGKILCNQDIDPQTEDTIQAVLKMGDHDLFEGCRRILDENDCLIVIDGLRSRDDWNMIKSTLLSGPIKGCVLVITNEECVATHCVDDKDRALNSNCRVAEGLALSTRKEEAQDWTNNFELLRHEDIDITNLLKEGPGVASVWGIAGVGKSALVKSVYYRVMLGLYPIYRWAKDPRDRLRRKFTAYSWVDVPHPFNLTEFSRRLLLDFHSDDLQAKETAIVGIIEGQDPIQGCRRFLREHECFVVIDGLWSTDD